MRFRTAQPSLASNDGVRAAYAAHGNELYRAARRLCGDGALAEEIVQETFVRAWRAADRYDEQLGSLRTWLFGIMRHLVIDQARAAAVRPLRAGSVPAGSTPEPVFDADEIDRAIVGWQVEEAMRRLTADHQAVLVEVHLRGRSIADVAGDLGVPEGTVKSRVYYGLRALRVALDELGWHDDAVSERGPR
jgi:RNA polymerase sigma-70 factor, ECF subfamily